MSTEYKITTKIPHFGLTRFAGGQGQCCCLHIHKYVSYYETYSLKYTYPEVLTLKVNMINFLRTNKEDLNTCYQLVEGFSLKQSGIKTLITDLHIYLNDEIHKID